MKKHDKTNNLIYISGAKNGKADSIDHFLNAKKLLSEYGYDARLPRRVQLYILPHEMAAESWEIQVALEKVLPKEEIDYITTDLLGIMACDSIYMEENRQRIRVIEDFLKTNPDSDEKECKENIFVLTETNKALGFIIALKPHILNKAVDTYGAAAQTDMAIEEMSELTKALLKFRRAENNPEEYDIERKRLDIYEEMADVMIMLAQLIMIYDGGFCEAELCEIIGDKVKRLEERLNKSK